MPTDYIKQLALALRRGVQDVFPIEPLTNIYSNAMAGKKNVLSSEWQNNPQMRNAITNIGLAGLTAGKGYGNAPDWAMGFRKNGPQKGWDEQGYKFIQNVEVKWPDGQKIIDAQKGLNSKHALERARRNWEGAEITPLTPEEAIAKGGESW